MDVDILSRERTKSMKRAKCLYEIGKEMMKRGLIELDKEVEFDLGLTVLLSKKVFVNRITRGIKLDDFEREGEYEEYV